MAAFDAFAMAARRLTATLFRSWQIYREPCLLRSPEFKELARVRLREALALSRAGGWSGVCYLSGYAIECGLKAAIVEQFRASTLPDKDLVLGIYTQ